LLVIGGGYVGLELAQAYRRFGRAGAVVEHGRRVLRRGGAGVSAGGGRVPGGGGAPGFVGAEGGSGRAAGRKGERGGGTGAGRPGGRVPNTAGIGLEQAGVELDDRGYVHVNDRLETTAPGVWAIGECAGSPQFTHVSADDFQIIRANLAGGSRSTRDRLVPYCVFTDPPLAHVGLSEGDAARQGLSARVAKLPMSGVLRVQATGER